MYFVRYHRLVIFRVSGDDEFKTPRSDRESKPTPGKVQSSWCDLNAEANACLVAAKECIYFHVNDLNKLTF